MTHLSISLLGPMQIVLDGRPVNGFTYNKARALLAYLVVEADRPHTRDEIVGLLWPDLPDAAARTNLRQALADLRKVMGDEAVAATALPPLLLVTRDSLQLNPARHYTLDVTQFTTRLDACARHLHRHAGRCPACMARIQQAVDYYRGDFLAGFMVNDTAPFEEWVVLKRETFHQRAQAALLSLTNYHFRHQAYATAIEYARRQLELAPWCEEAHQQLMQLYAAINQRSAALAQYITCQRLLAQELDVEPSAETVALYEQIRGGKLDKKSGRVEDKEGLPLPPTPLVGRQQELSELGELLANPTQRLITISGPGGIGKTRLALALAAAQADTFLQGVAFVPLTAITNPAFLSHAILRALGQPLQGSQNPQAQLVSYLHDKEVLLVLDNYEQLLPEVALLTELLARASRVTLLVTSRERLALQAEHLFTLTGLTYPQPRASGNLAEFAAIELFLQRVRQFQRHVPPTGEEMAAIVRICRITEGMPLALELAAAAVRTQSVLAIAAAFEVSQPLPSARLRDLPARHLSMQAVFEQSWRLLTAQEQAVLAQFSVFRGGFALDAAEKVAGAEVETLAALIDKSLVRVQAQDRFDLHELLRQFAAEKLSESGQKDETHWRHLCYFLVLAETLEREMIGPPQAALLTVFDRECDNFRAALAWGFATPIFPQPVAASVAWLAAHLGRFWDVRRHWQEGRTWLAKALAMVERQTEAAHSASSRQEKRESELYAKLLLRAGSLANAQNECRVAQTLLKRSLVYYRALGDLRATARCLHQLGTAVNEQGNAARARALFDASLVYARHINDSWCIANSLTRLANLLLEQNDPQPAMVLVQESLAIFRRHQDDHNLLTPLILLASCHIALGDYAQATTLLEEVLVLNRAINPQSKGGPWTYRKLGFVEQMQGHYERAVEYYRRSLVLRQEQQQPAGMAWALEGLVEVAAATGQPARAARLGGAAEKLRRQVGSMIAADDRPRYEQAIRQIGDALGEAKFHAVWAEGKALSPEQMVAYALADAE